MANVPEKTVNLGAEGPVAKVRAELDRLTEEATAKCENGVLVFDFYEYFGDRFVVPNLAPSKTPAEYVDEVYERLSKMEIVVALSSLARRFGRFAWISLEVQRLLEHEGSLEPPDEHDDTLYVAAFGNFQIFFSIGSHGSYPVHQYPNRTVH